MAVVDIIIPVFNTANLIENTVQNILSQRYSDFRIILIDDGSTDGSSVVCDNISKIDKRILVIHQSNQGVSAARNKGLDIVSAPYVAFIDSDDLIHPRYLELLLTCMRERDVDYVSCSFQHVEEKSIDFKDIEFKFDDLKVLSPVEIIKHMFGNDQKIGLAAWAGLFKSEIILKHKLRFNEGIHVGEDTLFKIDYILKCSQIVSCPYNMYAYVIRENSAVNSKWTDVTYQRKRTSLVSHEMMQCLIREECKDEMLANRIYIKNGLLAFIRDAIRSNYNDPKMYQEVQTKANAIVKARQLKKQSINLKVCVWIMAKAPHTFKSFDRITHYLDTFMNKVMWWRKQ